MSRTGERIDISIDAIRKMNERSDDASEEKIDLKSKIKVKLTQLATARIDKKDTLIENGFIDKYVKFASYFLPRCESFHKLLAVQAIGHCLYKISTPLAKIQYLHIFLLLLGMTGLGKSYAMDICKRVLFANNKSSIQVFSSGSFEGLMNSVWENQVIVSIREFGTLYTKSYSQGIDLFLINAWDREYYKHTTVSNQSDGFFPRFSLVAATTEEKLRDSIKNTDFSSGFFPRLIVNSGPILPDIDRFERMIEMNIRHFCKDVEEKNEPELARTIDYFLESTEKRVVQISEELFREMARRIWEIKDSFSIKMGEEMAEIFTSRWDEHVKRISIILAQLDDKDVVESEHIDGAFKIMLMNEDNTIRSIDLMVGKEEDQNTARIARHLEKKNGIAGRRKIIQALKMKSVDFDKAVTYSSNIRIPMKRIVLNGAEMICMKKCADGCNDIKSCTREKQVDL